MGYILPTNVKITCYLRALTCSEAASMRLSEDTSSVAWLSSHNLVYWRLILSISGTGIDAAFPLLLFENLRAFLELSNLSFGGCSAAGNTSTMFQKWFYE